jgi:hypothetical protein
VPFGSKACRVKPGNDDIPNRGGPAR